MQEHTPSLKHTQTYIQPPHTHTHLHIDPHTYTHTRTDTIRGPEEEVRFGECPGEERGETFGTSIRIRAVGTTYGTVGTVGTIRGGGSGGGGGGGPNVFKIA